ncbi:MAG: HEAT repeat domain-containing protein [Acidobacteria bacterium]|nr:HEAT repeat domain-containing protein [Acidobacteriota bacterium]
MSLWVKPAYSLRIEIAQRLRRHDVLWWTASPPPPPPVAVAPAPPAGTAPAPPPPPPPARTPKGRRVAPVAPPDMPPPAPAPATPPVATTAPPPTPPAPPAAWFTETYHPDTDLRIQALGSLIRTDADRVIPMLKKIALESSNPGEARRAVFVLAQSGRPDARSTVVDVAMNGPDTVRVAAVRELGRFGGAGLSKELLQVYSKSSNVRVKTEVVTSLGARAETVALLRIAQSESDRRLRDRAIVTLGQAGGGDQLQTLYARVAADAKRPIIMGLFHAGADDALIRIAERERDEALRREVLVRLRLLGTPKALAYADKRRDR